MSRVINSFSRGILVLLIFGIMLIAMNAKTFVISIKPSVDFEELLEEDAKAGMHVKGNVCFAYDCFAEESTWTEYSDGSRTAAEKSNYYYVIPGVENFFAVEIRADKSSAMDDLVDETWEYLYGGKEPSSEVPVHGIMVKMDKETEDLFVEYLVEAGFTEDEIDDMGDLLIVEQYSMGAVRVMFLIGVVLLALGVFFFIRNYKKQEPKEPQQPQTPTNDDNGTYAF